MTEQNKITDESNDRIYFIQTPQIVWGLCRDPYEYTLWNVVKMIAGEQKAGEKNECFLSTEELAQACMMSVGKAKECRDRLLAIGLLQGEIRKDPEYPQPVWHLRIPDLWSKNLEWRIAHHSLLERIEMKTQQKAELKAERKPKRERERARRKSLHSVKPSQCEEGGSQCEEGGSQCETKKNQKENQPTTTPALESPQSIETVSMVGGERAHQEEEQESIPQKPLRGLESRVAFIDGQSNPIDAILGLLGQVGYSVDDETRQLVAGWTVSEIQALIANVQSDPAINSVPATLRHRLRNNTRPPKPRVKPKPTAQSDKISITYLNHDIRKMEILSLTPEQLATITPEDLQGEYSQDFIDKVMKRKQQE